jgi:hypothetical protein
MKTTITIEKFVPPPAEEMINIRLTRIQAQLLLAYIGPSNSAEIAERNRKAVYPVKDFIGESAADFFYNLYAGIKKQLF